MKILLTGVAGFIGMHVAKRLLSRGDSVVGVDSLNNYYSPALKNARLTEIEPHAGFRFAKLDISDRDCMEELFARERPQCVIHLAAQAGVRYSLTNPHAYADSNLVGFLNVLEGCRNQNVEHFVFASSSSVYGGNTKMPYIEGDNVDHPVSLYAATKKANELMAHAYSHLYSIPSTGLRFFTVYGPWGRPDMAYWLFTEAILAGKPIDIFNNGQMLRDFTFVDDIVEGIIRVIDRPPAINLVYDKILADPSTSWAPWRVLNIGNSSPVKLLDFVEALEQALGKFAIKNFLPMQAGDVAATFADTNALGSLTGFLPQTPLAIGVERFVAWYRSYK
jgi:UDP-glucuronate 4-epimerase